MRLVLFGTLLDNLQLVTQELPDLAHKIYFESNIGGKTARKIMEKLGVRKWKVLSENANSFEAEIWLGKPSAKFVLGRRHINIKATTEKENTVVEIFATKNSGMIAICTLIGFAAFLVPGVLAFFINRVWDTKLEGQVINISTNLKTRYAAMLAS